VTPPCPVCESDRTGNAVTMTGLPRQVFYCYDCHAFYDEARRGR
jgi:transposase-like protein